MKNLSLFCLLLTCIGLGSCKNNQSEKIIEAKEAKELVSEQCYKAVYEKDTLDLKINTFKDGEITGDMVMAIATMPKKVGEIIGEFRGDTLFASYTFIQGANKEKTFKNPMAFLKRGNELILGNGQIQITMGASHFVKGEPIDFERVKYKFSEVDCVEK
ncbi:hypothetical protein SAMN05444395_10973 [Flavobacterium fryxellicola]|uniref:Lipoprotein n=1 Tax=Flavobacterium fryxellicola TaxID=249352 RepID=A0A167U6J1_9FLAO|nr:hypothetical protein [Flavobacterium fryxellicola]OAB25303.1 hypothetical protein FBFR_15050 [Flavobacterium fryxellicola]SHN75299.1 hypothetical protein SAMN05444395_10973 [Flavobacterium fryxellicola]